MWWVRFCNVVLGDLSPFKEEESASVAKERLKIVVSHERRSSINNSEFLGKLDKLQEELIQVIAKYIDVDQNQVKVELQRNSGRSVLELSAVLPEKTTKSQESPLNA